MFYDCTAHKATRVQLPQQQKQQQQQHQQQEQLTVQQSLTMWAFVSVCVCVHSQTTLKLLHPLAWEKSWQATRLCRKFEKIFNNITYSLVT